MLLLLWTFNDNAGGHFLNTDQTKIEMVLYWYVLLPTVCIVLL